MPRQIKGTLTLSSLIFAYILSCAIILYKLYAIAIFKYVGPLLPKNYICIFAFVPNL